MIFPQKYHNMLKIFLSLLTFFWFCGCNLRVPSISKTFPVLNFSQTESHCMLRYRVFKYFDFGVSWKLLFPPQKSCLENYVFRCDFKIFFLTFSRIFWNLIFSNVKTVDSIKKEYLLFLSSTFCLFRDLDFLLF